PDTHGSRLAYPSCNKSSARKLLYNPHRLTLTLRPDEGLSARQVQAEVERLAAIKARLGADEVAAILRQAEELKARQARKDDESILPKVGLEDIPREMAYVAPAERLDSPLPL